MITVSLLFLLWIQIILFLLFTRLPLLLRYFLMFSLLEYFPLHLLIFYFLSWEGCFTIPVQSSFEVYRLSSRVFMRYSLKFPACLWMTQFFWKDYIVEAVDLQLPWADESQSLFSQVMDLLLLENVESWWFSALKKMDWL